MFKYSTNLIVSSIVISFKTFKRVYIYIYTHTPYPTHYTHSTSSQLHLQYKSISNFFILIFSFFPIWNQVFHFPSLLSKSPISLCGTSGYISYFFFKHSHCLSWKVIFLLYFYFKLFCNIWFLLLYKF